MNQKKEIKIKKLTFKINFSNKTFFITLFFKTKAK